MKSLLVDDDPTTIRLLQEVLAPYGPVQSAPNGSQAIDLFRRALDDRAPFHLVCLDVGLPDRAGNQLLGSLRWMERARRISPQRRARILMVSANSDRDLIRSVVAEGCDGYILKPVHPPSLLTRLTQLGLMDAEGPARRAPL